MTNTEIVLNIIKKTSKNLTAYEILERLQKIKKTQPMTVYRALDKLIEEGKIHKNNINKTFVLCKHDHREDENTTLAICNKCGDTEELESNLFFEILSKKPIKNFNLSNFSMQIIATCKGCN
jgi:Fur family zinc uptake transcriptional regulator